MLLRYSHKYTDLIMNSHLVTCLYTVILVSDRLNFIVIFGATFNQIQVWILKTKIVNDVLKICDFTFQ